ncbi:MAG TPA: zinc-finger domain-containing protein [Gallionellaceae bacterium]|nr:zinc-finger domain-containing protein [Gallionellaceae bacterium]
MSTQVENVIEVSAADLPLYCPRDEKGVWSSHPRVALAVEKMGAARCPYCGTLYRYTGPAPSGHH